MKSLQQFVTKETIPLAARFDLNPIGLQKTFHENTLVRLICKFIARMFADMIRSILNY